MHKPLLFGSKVISILSDILFYIPGTLFQQFTALADEEFINFALINRM